MPETTIRPEPPAPESPPAIGVVSWCVFDWANSAFNTVVGTFVFSVYFTRAVAESEIAGTAQWSRALAVAGLCVAVLSPVFGAIADRVGTRKPWLAVFVAITVATTAAMWSVRPTPEWVTFALVSMVIASVAFELCNVFYNAMLPHLVPEARIGRVSGWGWGLGYAGGLCCLVIALLGFVQAENPWFGVSTAEAANIRASAPLVAVWFALFALPLFAFTPDQERSGARLGQAIREGLAVLWQTVREVRQYADIARLLVASALYREGLNTLFAFGGIYAAGTFGMTFEQIIVFAIALNVTAGLGATGFGWIDDWIGPKRTIVVSLIGLIGFGMALLLVTSQLWFWVLALGLGIFVGPAQAASRSFMARLAPTDMTNEMFGLYALAGKATAFLGPLALGLATETFASQRAGMATIIVFFTAGLAVLANVRPIGAAR